MLQTFFGDDEHTSADGPYARVMKARRWLYGTAVVATAFNMHLLKLGAIKDVLKVLDVSEPVFRHTLLFALIYLGIQFIILTAQVAVSYDIILSDRAKARKDDDLRSAQKLVDESKKDVLRLERELEEQKPQRRGGVTVTKSSSNPEAAQAALNAAESIYNRNVHELSAIVGRDPTQRRLYRLADYAIDAIRIFTPIVISSIAIIGLVLHW